jgi:hypothetical protein
MCLADLKLIEYDKHCIEGNEMFDDKVVYAAQFLLKRQSNVAGLDSTLLTHVGGFNQATHQYHFDDMRKH